MLLESDRALTRARRLRSAFGAALVTSLVLVASLAGNWIVNGPPGPLARLVSGGSREAATTGAAPVPAPRPAQGGWG